MSEEITSEGPPAEVVGRVRSAFLVYGRGEIATPLKRLSSSDPPWAAILDVAANGLESVVSAATLPFQLTLNAVEQRKFDRLLSAERIRSLNSPSEDRDEVSYRVAAEKMSVYMKSKEGAESIRDSVVYELDRSLGSKSISDAASELIIHTLIATWSVFETFTSSFIMLWTNLHPTMAHNLVRSADLKTYFGKSTLDVEDIQEHGFDLTKSMGELIFKGKRLDNLAVIRSATGILFSDDAVRLSLGEERWLLNQRRHLFVHKRGIVDREYLRRTNDSPLVGAKLSLTGHDVERYLLAVRDAITALGTAGAANLRPSSQK